MRHTGVKLAPLSADECWGLLASHEPRLGRVAFVADGRPVVYPMNYAVADRTIYLRTDPQADLARATGQAVVAFEVDDTDVTWRRGWSVLLQGRLIEVTDADELERHRQLVLRTWAPGTRLHLLRLDADHVSGRRLA